MYSLTLKEPTREDLAAIEAEWPQIEADLLVVDAQISALATEGGPSVLGWRRLRRTEHRVLTVRRLISERSRVSGADVA